MLLVSFLCWKMPRNGIASTVLSGEYEDRVGSDRAGRTRPLSSGDSRKWRWRVALPNCSMTVARARIIATRPSRASTTLTSCRGFYRDEGRCSHQLPSPSSQPLLRLSFSHFFYCSGCTWSLKKSWKSKTTQKIKFEIQCFDGDCALIDFNHWSGVGICFFEI